MPQAGDQLALLLQLPALRQRMLLVRGCGAFLPVESCLCAVQAVARGFGTGLGFVSVRLQTAPTHSSGTSSQAVLSMSSEAVHPTYARHASTSTSSGGSDSSSNDGESSAQIITYPTSVVPSASAVLVRPRERRSQQKMPPRALRS